MTDTIINPNINIPPQPPVLPVEETPTQAPMGQSPLISKAKGMFSAGFNKFYTNKKIFWPVSIAVGFLVLVVLLGLIFGNRNGSQTVSKTPTPSPIAQGTPESSASGDILSETQIKLNDLKKQVNSLDVRASRLKPPVLDFDIKF
jgi:hypothetical protein